MGVASQFFDIPIPMPALRDQPSLSAAPLESVLHAGGGRLEFHWTDAQSKTEYEVYRGELTSVFTYAHDAAIGCGIPAESTSWSTPDDQETAQPSYYYLVVPRRGSLRVWGAADSGLPRPPSPAPCP